MDSKLITDADVARRSHWVARIAQASASFAADAGQLEQELADEVKRQGSGALVGHLRLCGAMPESYAYDGSAEKRYAKYTDAVIHEAFKAIGLTSAVLTERTDAADVECVCDSYSFVADAKAFRLSRSAKNQKDFKIQALDNWKHGKPYAMVVCPVYQLPSRTSQIYQQAAARSVCVYTYTHLAFLVRHVEDANTGTVCSKKCSHPSKPCCPRRAPTTTGRQSTACCCVGAVRLPCGAKRSSLCWNPLRSRKRKR